MANKLAKVVITLDGKRVEYGLDQIRQKVKQLTAEMDQMAKEGKQNSQAFKERVKAVNKLHKAEEDVVEVTKRISQYMKDLGNVATTDLRRAYREGIQLREGFKGTDLQLKQLNADLAAMKMQIDKNTGSTTAMAKAQQGFAGALGTTLKNLVAYMGVFAAFNKAKAMFGEFVDKNKEFSDQLANVRKVSNLAMDDIDKLAVSLSKIDSRTSLKGLMELSYTGAKLGFGNYGIEGLESFAKSAVKVQNALSEDMGADAMTALSKMVEVMGLIPKMGVERAMDATGSAIFKLASTSTATGTNIVEFSKRLMGLANIAHITAPELLAIGSAADSMALAPEVAATAFNKLITAVQKQPNLIENALKIDKGTISDLFQAGKMTDALVLIFEKMREKGGMNALMQSGVFKDLGSDGARLVAVMATMANRVDMLNAHLAVSRQAFEEGTAVAQEYAIQMDTAAAYSERAANIWEKAFVNPEGVNVVRDLSKAWYEVSKSLTENEKIMFGIKVSLQGIILLLKTILTILPEIIFTLGISGMAAMIARMREGEGLLASLTAWFGKLSTAQKVFFKAAGWVGLAITILEVGKAIYDMANKTKEATIYMKGFNDSLGDLKTELGKSEAELKRYRRAIDEANVGSKQRLAAINTFNSKFSPYLKNLLTEKSTAQDVADAYEAINKAMRAKLALQLKEKDINDQVLPREQWTAERRTEYDKRAKAAGYGQYGSTWITGYAQDNAGKSIDAMIRDIGKRFYNLPNVIIDEVAKQAKAGNTDFNNYGNIINSRYLGAANALLGANAYLRQDRSAQNAMRRINQKWAPEQKAMDAYMAANQQQDVIEPLTPAPDKGAEKELTKAQQEEKKRLKDQMEEAQKDSTAVINAIEEFYRLQETAVEQLVADGKMTREEADKLIDYVRNRKDEMLMNARRAIAGKDSKFEDLRKDMGKDMLRANDPNSQRAMNTVQTIDVAEAARRLQKFDGSKAVYDLNAGSFTQAMLKNAAQNELNIQRRQAAVQTEIDKLLLQYQYVEQAQRDFGDKLVKLGLVTDGYDKVVKQLADGTEIVANTRDVQGFANKVVGMGSRLYNVNPDDANSLKQLIGDVMTNGKGERESFAAIFPNLDKWMKQPEQYKEEMQAMYDVMIQYEGIYYDKLKQRDDLQQKRLNSWWEHSDEKKANDKQLRNLQLYEFEYNTMKQGETMGFMMGLTNDVSQDPEVLREQAILEAKMAIWKKAKEEREAGLISEEVYQQRLRDMQDQTMAYTQKVMDNINKRISRIQGFVKPVETAANSIGKKLGDMIFNMESEEATWEQIWKNMALAVAESMLTMAGQYAQNLIVKSSMNRAEEGEEGAHAAVMTALGISEGASKTIGTLGWVGIALIPVITSLLMGLLTSALSTKRDNGSTANTNVKTKLTSGMLTYDEGNVGTYQGSDGQSYRATAVAAPGDGLVTRPIATTVQGQPALVAERGPEIVIGRRTTKAIMMNEPGLIRYLANYGKGASAAPRYRAFDEGNLDSLQLPDADAQPSATDAEMRNTLVALTQVVGQLQKQLDKGIKSTINMYGSDGLYENMNKANKFMGKYGG